jgi:dolichol-phosphate mannosyltransferase
LEVDRVEPSFALRTLKRLLSPRVLRFLAVGFSGVFVNLGVLYVLIELLGMRQAISSPIAIEMSIIWNFILNDAWTFRDRNETARAGYGERLVRYNMASLVGLGIQFGTSMVVTKMAMRVFDLSKPGIWTYLSQLVGIALGTVWNFVSNFFWTWAQEKPQESAAEPAEPVSHE